MEYQREIKYLEYYVRCERSGNVGFLKRELRNHKCSMEVRITGLPNTDHFKQKVYLNDVEIGAIDVCEGRGYLRFEDMPENNIEGTGISYEQMKILHIPISSDRKIWCVIGYSREQLVEGQIGQPQGQSQEWRAGQPQGQSQEWRAGQPQGQSREWRAGQLQEQSRVGQIGQSQEQSQERVTEVQEERTTEAQEERVTEAQEERVTEVQEERASEAQEERATGVQEGRTTGTHRESTPEVRAESMAETLRKRRVTTKDSKWAQLWEIYPHIHPFQDEREYLSVGPNDFVILSEKHYRLIHNSFLLHGFYNYHHLTLQKRNRNQGNRYYIGVPGNFYEREKQVAVMFGFESFECKKEPAGEGDFGYYMIPVEL